MPYKSPRSPLEIRLELLHTFVFQPDISWNERCCILHTNYYTLKKHEKWLQRHNLINSHEITVKGQKILKLFNKIKRLLIS